MKNSAFNLYNSNEKKNSQHNKTILHLKSLEKVESAVLRSMK